MKKKFYILIALLMLVSGSSLIPADTADAAVVTLNKKSIVLLEGDAFRLSAQTDGISGSLKWSSADKKIAAVNKKGKVRAKKKGSTTITVTMGDTSASCRIKVIRAALNQSVLKLNEGGSGQLEIRGTGRKVEWSSSNPLVAEVDSEGKVTGRKKGTAVISAVIGCSTLKCTVKVKKDRWSKLLDKYLTDPETNQLIFVQYKGESKAKFYMYTKISGAWDCVVKGGAYVGKNGIGKTREGDGKTPTGTFSLTGAFGIRENPGARLNYTQVNEYLYWCGDSAYYNQLVDLREKPHACRGEHLITYVPFYNYGAFLDYNKECVQGKGSAIFLHCTKKGRKYTAGCIAVNEANMRKVLQYAEAGTKICIYPQ